MNNMGLGEIEIFRYVERVNWKLLAKDPEENLKRFGGNRTEVDLALLDARQEDALNKKKWKHGHGPSDVNRLKNMKKYNISQNN